MGARLELSSSCIDNVGYGVTVYQSSAAVLTDCSVAGGTGFRGNWVTGAPSLRNDGVASVTRDLCCIQSFNSEIELSSCVLDGKHENTVEAFRVYAHDSSVKLQGCRVLRNGTGVALMRSEGVLAACEWEKSGAINVVAAGHSSLDMRACVCKGEAQNGVEVWESDCTLRGVKVVGCQIGFVLGCVRSHAEITDCQAVGVTACGMRVQGAGARVRVQGFEVRGVAQQQARGIYVHDAGGADLLSCKLAVGSEGPAVLALGNRSEVGGEDCQLSGDVGVLAGEGAQVTLRRCATCECVDRGYHVDNRASLSLYNCTSTADYAGFYCREQGFLHAQDCELRGFSCGAVVSSEQGIGAATCKLDRCRFVDPEPSPTKREEPFFAGVALYVGGKDAHLSMHGCTVSGATGTSVWVSVEAKATLEDCQLSHSQREGVACTERGSEVFLDRCNISKCERNGVLCLHGARVVARRVHSCGNKGAGFAAPCEGRITLKECSSDKDYVGFRASGAVPGGQGAPTYEGTARVVLSGVLVRRSTTTGFLFDSDVKGCMKHCTALQCVQGGMTVMEGGMKLMASVYGWPLNSGTAPGLHVFDSTFERCGGGGVSVSGGSTVGMQNVLCSGDGGWAFRCSGAGSRLELTRCEALGSGEHYHCADGGKVHCNECHPSGPCDED